MHSCISWGLFVLNDKVHLPINVPTKVSHFANGDGTLMEGMGLDSFCTI